MASVPQSPAHANQQTSQEEAASVAAALAAAASNETWYIDTKSPDDIFAPRARDEVLDDVKRLRREPSQLDLSSNNLSAIQELLWGRNPVPEDQMRWNDQGFRLAASENINFGFDQKSGGPCGVLVHISKIRKVFRFLKFLVFVICFVIFVEAPVGAFVLRFLLFDWDPPSSSRATELLAPPKLKSNFRPYFEQGESGEGGK